MDGSLEICRASVDLGVSTIVATPHVSWDYANTAADIAARVAELNAELARQRIALTILAGAEVAISKAVELDDAELAALRLGGGPWLLAEPPFSPSAAGLDTMIHQLRARGHRLIIAHPERCPTYLKDRASLERLAADGVLFSVTAGSLRGQFGKDSKRFADSLLSEGLAHNVASDAHSIGRRKPGMADELKAAGFGAQTDWLCRAVPRALLDGQEPPRRTNVATSRQGALSRLFRA